MQINVPSLGAQQASIQSLDIGQAKIGPVTVGDLVITNADLALAASQIVLHGITVRMTIKFVVELTIHVGLPKPFPAFDRTLTIHLPTLHIPAESDPPIPLSDVTIPQLTNMRLHIPTLLAQNMSLNADPLALHADAAAANTIQVASATLPAGQFTIAGLSLQSMSGDNISLPDGKFASASIGRVTGTPVHAPAFSVNTVRLGSASMPNGASTTAPMDIPAELGEYDVKSPGTPHKSLAVLTLKVTPFTLMHVDRLDIGSGGGSASIDSIVLHNVTLPYDVLNLTLSQIGINSIQIPTFSVA